MKHYNFTVLGLTQTAFYAVMFIMVLALIFGSWAQAGEWQWYNYLFSIIALLMGALIYESIKEMEVEL